MVDCLAVVGQIGHSVAVGMGWAAAACMGLERLVFVTEEHQGQAKVDCLAQVRID